MKRFFALLFAFCLLISLLAGCGEAPDPGDTEKNPFVIQSVYDDYDVSDSPDPAPVDQLCQYLTERLSPGEYLMIQRWEASVPGAPGKESEGKTDYYLLIYGADIEIFRKLLDSYDGPLVPILFGEASYSMSDLIKAEEDIRGFMENNRESVNAKIQRWDQVVYVSNIMRGYEELKRFADEYPVPEMFIVER